jgi:hypothetical protein
MDGFTAFKIYISCVGYFNVKNKTNRGLPKWLKMTLQVSKESRQFRQFTHIGESDSSKLVWFEALARKYDFQKLLIYFIANFIYGNKRAMYDDQNKAVALMNRFLGNREKMTYIVRRDLESAKNHISKEYLSGKYLLEHNYEELTKDIASGNIWLSDPICLFNLYKADIVTIETLVAVDRVTHIVDKFKEYKEMKAMCDEEFYIIRKAIPFFGINECTEEYIKTFFNIK